MCKMRATEITDSFVFEQVPIDLNICMCNDAQLCDTHSFDKCFFFHRLFGFRFVSTNLFHVIFVAFRQFFKSQSENYTNMHASNNSTSQQHKLLYQMVIETDFVIFKRFYFLFLFYFSLCDHTKKDRLRII